MGFAARLYAEAKDDFSFVLIAALVLTSILVQARARGERVRLRGMFMLVALHLVCLPILAGLRAEPIAGAYGGVRLAALTFEVLAFFGMAGTLLFGVILPRLGVHAPNILRDVIIAAACVVTLIVIANRLGFPLSGVITTSAILTAVIGFSLQDTLGNIVGGLALQLDNSIRVGDWVRIGDLRGRVADIRWRYTAVETRNWETVVVPNGMLTKGQVIVEGRRADHPEQLRRWVWFNVDFRHDPTRVIDAVEAALRAAPIAGVALDPSPNCVLMDLHESYDRYAVRYWLTNLVADDATDSVVRTRIYFALRRAGLPLSIPAQAVFVTEDTVARKQGKAQKELERRQAALARVEIFDGLDQDSRARLTDHLRHAPFARGETMTRQGAEGHWLYMIVEGEVGVRVAQDGVEREVARLSSGMFFGEMSLLTGAPRTATVVAISDVDCYRLDKEGFQEILRARPEIAEGVAGILARRRADLSLAREDLDAAARERRLVEDKRALLDKIRTFFGLGPDDSPRR